MDLEVIFLIKLQSFFNPILLLINCPCRSFFGNVLVSRPRTTKVILILQAPLARERNLYYLD